MEPAGTRGARRVQPPEAEPALLAGEEVTKATFSAISSRDLDLDP